MLKFKSYFPIDVVYLWVDGSDKNFISIKNDYLRKLHKNNNKYIDDTKDQIFRDNDELKYSLRSLEKNAPWVNHVYIVTPFGQKPKWLNTRNKKITIIPQEDILPKDAGPIFNSCAVETCLANIPGLSEHFLLANDDMFFNKPVMPDYFFDKSGRAKFRCIYRKNGKIIRDKKSIYLKLLINSAREIEKAFDISLYNYKSSHGIDPYIKSSMKECCEHPILSKAIKNTKYRRFRDEDDVHRLIFNLYDIVKKRASVKISHSKHIGHNVILDFIYNLLYYKSVRNSVFFCNDAIKSKVLSCDAPIVCINDSVYNNDITREHNKQFFDTKFPNKSKFEK
ncbi:MAG: Stealth CR1 domain-containing protein [Alphaproteobacteria bacterium]|nr:Stealth CR1 domain-containing protein [Alphaproteobacteria bacterium]